MAISVRPSPTILAIMLSLQSCGPTVVVEEDSAGVAPSPKPALDTKLVPALLHRYGQFAGPFVEVVQAPDSSTLWWGRDSANLRPLGSDTFWVDSTMKFWIQARKADRRGPMLDVNLEIRKRIDFASDDPQSQYADDAQYSRMLKNIHILGFGWSTQGSSLEFSKGADSELRTNLILRYALHGKYPSVGVGLQIGGAIDSLGPHRGEWGIDLSGLASIELRYDATGIDPADTKLILKIASMDSSYGDACAKGICLQRPLGKDLMKSRSAIVGLDEFRYPEWSNESDRPKTSIPEILRRSSGILLSVESVPDSVGSIAGTLRILSLEFSTKDHPSGATIGRAP